MFEISPVIGEGINFANGSNQSIYSEVKVSWKKEKEKVAFDIEVPVNTKATFIFRDKTELLEPGKHHFCL